MKHIGRWKSKLRRLHPGAHPWDSRQGRLLVHPLRLILAEVANRILRRLGLQIRIPVRLFWGQWMQVWLPEVVSKHLAQHGYFEAGLTAIMTRRIQPGWTVFDVGAHFGYFSLLASRLTGASGCIIAFEPTPSTRHRLITNVRRNTRIHVEPLALWSSNGLLELRDFGLVSSAYNTLLADSRLREEPPSQRIVVPSARLDDYVAASGVQPDFVKIDAESAELEILHGMARLLAEVRPEITIEVGDVGANGAPQSCELVAYLESRRYVGFEHKNGSLVRHRSRPDYDYDNLLFVPEERASEVADK